MLDTNMVSEFLNRPDGMVAARIARQPAAISISIVVAAELRFGAAKKGSARLTARIETLLGLIDIEPLASPVDVVYGGLRAKLEREGKRMDANDLLIAAHALVLGRGLVTRDKAFSRVVGLSVEDWSM
jgi:tRNA(fMet)-specific endonuclease VapC